MFDSQNLEFELLDKNKNTVFKDILDTKSKLGFSKRVKNPLKWTAEDPNLYTLIISVYDKNKKLIQVIPQKVGFRKIDIKGEVFTVNGVIVKFKGVNRHDYNPKNGRVVARDEIEKRHNINEKT